MAILTNHSSNVPATPTKRAAQALEHNAKRQCLSPELTPNKHAKGLQSTTGNTGSSSIPLTPETTPTKSKVVAPLVKGRRLDMRSLYVDSIYSRAKALFQRSSSTTHHQSLVGREKEAAVLNAFIANSVRASSGSSLYIAGPPGTGKSEQTNVSLANAEKLPCTTVKINCMIVNNPHHIFHEIYCGITGELSIAYHRKKTSADLKELVTRQKDAVLVVLDEMDCLITRNQEILFELFALTTMSRFVLVGISNSLDFTNKFLPRLSRNGVEPQLLQFLPYSCDQIRSIIVNKLESLCEDKENLDGAPRGLFHPAALQLCCKKSASTTGDLRNAFDLCYKAIELVENSLKTQGRDLTTYDISNCPQVLLPHVAKVCTYNALTKASSLSALNLLQKTVLCYLFKFQITNLGQVVTVNGFYDYYLTNNNRLVATVNKGEFLEIVQALESSSCVLLVESKLNDLGNHIVKLSVPYDDLEKMASGGVLNEIMRR